MKSDQIMETLGMGFLGCVVIVVLLLALIVACKIIYMAPWVLLIPVIIFTVGLGVRYAIKREWIDF